MKLATFLAPGASDPQAGEVRGDEIVAFEHGTVLDRHRLRRPPTGHRPDPPDRERHVPGADPAPARDLLHRPQLRRPHRGAQEREAGQAARVPQAPALQRAARRPRDPAPSHPRRSTTRPSWSWSWAATTRSPATRSPTTSPHETCSAARSSGRARRASTRPARGARGSRPTPTRPDLRITTHVNGEQRQDGSTSDLIFKPDELVTFIAETCTLEPGAIILTGTPSGVGEAFDPPRYLQPGDVVRCEVEGLGALEHSISEIR